MRPRKLSLAIEPPVPPPQPDSPVPLLSPPSSSPCQIKLAVDLPITLAGLAASFLPQMVGSASTLPANLNPNGLNAMDRSVIGNWSPAADRVSTGLLTASIVLPIAASLVDTWVSKPSDGYSGFLKDGLILAETYAVTSLITGIVKVSVSRPRPLVYDLSLSQELRNGSDSTHSFFSGHTALAFAMATSYSYLFMRRHPDSKLVIPVWVGSYALAAATGFLRVEAGQHFWSDVLVGAAVGSLIGFLVPYLHTKGNFFSRLFFGRERDSSAIHLSVGAGLGLSGSF